MTAPAASQAAITRALTAATEAGLRIARFSVARDGTVTVEAHHAAAESVDKPGNVVSPTPRAWGKR